MHVPSCVAAPGSLPGVDHWRTLEFVTDFVAWVAAGATAQPYLLVLAIFVAAAVEYIIPPLPGDTFALAVSVVALEAGFSIWLVVLFLTLGAVSGGQVAYEAGRYFGDRWIRQRPKAAGWLRDFEAAHQRFGAWAIALNRFVPAFRAAFFFGAGMARASRLKVGLLGALSALVWNLLIGLLALWVGANLELLAHFVNRFSWGAAAVIALVVFCVWLWRRKKKNPPVEVGLSSVESLEPKDSKRSRVDQQ